MEADNKLDVKWFSGLVCASTGFPRPHSAGAVAPAPGAGVVTEAAPAALAAAVVGFGLRRLDMIVLLPPRMFLMVAVWQWPAAGVEQVALVWFLLNPSP